MLKIQLPGPKPQWRKYEPDLVLASEQQPAVGRVLACCDFSSDPPPAPNYGEVTRDTLQAQIDLAPDLYASEAEYQPKYGALALSNLNKLLLGNGTDSGLYEIMRRQNSEQRQADIGDVERLGLRTRDAMLAANPENATLLRLLNQQAQSGLEAGSQLTPDQIANIRASQGDWANRGLGYSGPAMLDQATRRAMGGDQMLRQRQQFAQSMLQNNQAIVGDPFLQILGRQGSALGAAQNIQQSGGPQIFNPNAGNDMASGAYQAQVAASAADQGPLGAIGGILGGVGGLIGGLGSGGLGLFGTAAGAMGRR